jgi:alpha-D-ribose 1-methylphosphonate 5-triphosphate synthase subunit PhnI
VTAQRDDGLRQGDPPVIKIKDYKDFVQRIVGRDMKLYPYQEQMLRAYAEGDVHAAVANTIYKQRGYDFGHPIAGTIHDTIFFDEPHVLKEGVDPKDIRVREIYGGAHTPS